MKTLKRVLGKSKTSSTSGVDDEYHKRHSTKFRDVLERLKAVSKDRKKRVHEFDALPENLVFLQDIRFFNELRSLYPNVEVNIDIENGKLFLRGDSEEFNDAYNKCSWTLQKIAKGSLPFDDERIWDVIADSRVQEHLKSIISSKNIKAQIKAADNGQAIIITAIESVEWQKAKKVLLDVVVKKAVQISQDVDNCLDEFKKFLQEQERRLPVRAHFKSSMEVEIVGTPESSTKTARAIQTFFESKRIKQHIIPLNISSNKLRFLEMHFSDMKKHLNLNVVSVKFEKQSSGKCQITMTGTEKNFPECETELNKFIKKIVDKDEKITFPGLKKLFGGESGREEKKRIEQKRTVYIKIQSCTHIPVRAETVSPQQASDVANFIPRSETVSGLRTQSVYDRYNFTTKEGVKMSCRIGRIENEKVS